VDISTSDFDGQEGQKDIQIFVKMGHQNVFKNYPLISPLLQYQMVQVVKNPSASKWPKNTIKSIT